MTHKNALYTAALVFSGIVFYHKYGSKLGGVTRHGS